MAGQFVKTRCGVEYHSGCTICKDPVWGGVSDNELDHITPERNAW